MGAHENLGVLCDAQAISADATASENTIDLAQTTPKLGVGQHAPYLCIRTAVAPTDAADTLAIELQSDADDGAGAPVAAYRGSRGVLNWASQGQHGSPGPLH